MKRLFVNLFTLIIGIICGLLLGYFRFPYLEDQHTLTLGLAGGLAIGFILMLLFKGKKRRTHKIYPIAVSCLLILGLFGGVFYLSEQNRLAERELIKEKKELYEAKLRAAYKEAKKEQLSLVDFEMLGLRDRLAKQNSTQLTRDEIGRIQELSKLLIPIESSFDSLYSPGRGHLLLHLLQLQIDSASRRKVIKSTNFNYAELSYRDLSGSELSEINLRYANLKKANLRNAKLNRAKLEQANLWGGQLEKTQFKKAELVNCSLNWAQMTNADFSSAEMNGANLSYTFADSLKLNRATLKWATITGAKFSRSSLVDTDLFRATLEETVIKNSNLIGIKLFKSYLIKCNFSNSNLDYAKVKPNWLSNLDRNKLSNAREIKRQYVLDSSESKGKSHYFLKLNR